MNRSRREQERNQENGGAWTALGVLGGVAALAGGAYWLATRNNQNEPQPASQHQNNEPRSSNTPDRSNNNNVSDYLSRLLGYMTTSSSASAERSIPRSAVPTNPDITNLNGLLHDIFVRFVQLKDEDFELHYHVFIDIFFKLHETMKQVDPYYNRYSSTIQFAGSHYDRLRIKKPDEFDMDIIIGLPLNYNSHPEIPSQSDFFLEPKGPGFVQLKMGVQYRNLPLRDGADWLVNKAAYKWGDERDYLLGSKFRDWFKSVVTRALNANDSGRYVVDGVPYTVRIVERENDVRATNGNASGRYSENGVPFTIRTSESGPAFTLFIENRSRGFKLDVDLVPALRFPESRWPICRGYRGIPRNSHRDYWMVVPKPNKGAGVTELDQNRSWRIALQDQERAYMKNLNNCKIIIKLLKKLRDAQQMNKIASYYVKTLFLWEILERDDPNFWRKCPAELFKIMVSKFHYAMVIGSIPYFWNKDNNLIAGVERGILNTYAAKLERLLQVLDGPSSYKLVAKFLLTKEEFDPYNSRFLHIN